MTQIRKIEVRNFRSIRILSWFPKPGINCLVGPGDSGKSTILDAIDLCMGARRTIQFTDADFTDLAVDAPIEITITLGALSDRLKSLDTYGLFLRGFDSASGEIEDEPDAGLETVLCLKLTVSADLEPVWTLVSDRAAALGSERYLVWSDRQDIAPTRIGSFSDVNLSWKRSSVLNKLSKEKADASAILLAAARDARAKFGDTADDQLSEALAKVKEVADGLGIGDGNDLHAELDAHSVSVSAGTISLHNAEGIPLKGMGIGSTRLLIAGLQKEAAAGSAIVLVDEVEHGLEPHRIIQFLNALGAKDSEPSLQVFMTSHSPVVVRELGLTPLIIARRGNHGPDLKQAGDHPELQGTARLFPEAFLAKSVLVCEGATEVGFVRGIDQWLVDRGRPSLHAAGTSLISGGGDEMLKRASAFAALGYRTALLRDDDKPPDPGKEAMFELSGEVFKWQQGRKIEAEIFASVPPGAAIALLDLAIEELGQEVIDAQLSSASDRKVSIASIREPVLVLSHTNAGVAALRHRLLRHRVSQDHYRLSTIDGWALRILKTFPARSGIAPGHLDLEDAKRDYPAIKAAIARFLVGRHIDDVLFASYSRVIVDEYQDCDPDQHAMVCHLATILPTVVLGDPMQEIFNWRGHHPSWDDDVVSRFPLVAELTRPWRWENAGAHELGAWLLEARRILKAGDRIDLRTAPADVSWVHLDGVNDYEMQRRACLTQSPVAGGEVLIMTGGAQKDLQRKLAKLTPGAVTVEAVDLTDVTDFAREIDLDAPRNLEAALNFAFAVMTGVDREGIVARAATISAGRHQAPPEPHELAAIRYNEVGDAASLISLFDALEAAKGARTFRPEILRTCIKALKSSGPDVSFLEAAKRIREQQRVLGRLLPKKAVGSPLLLKGLEGDVAVILDACDFDREAAKNRKNLYVAMTRGSRKLVICSPTHLVG